ncbi:MAG: hypothetical protein JWO32_856 [Bacteroidetes bacterium]|nr:hypothetical protein [Bacteroidota bacterium]
MEYNIVATKRENLGLYSDLLSNVFTETSKYSLEFLKWQYFENPAGDVIGFDAFLGDELAAHYVTIPVLYKWGNRIIKGVLSLNTATGKAHQGKGLFLKLAKATYEEASRQGFEFVIGVANQNSTHGFINKLGFKLINKLEVKVYMGSVNEKKISENIFHACHDHPFMKWRLKNPKGTYFYSQQSIYSSTHLPFFKSLMTAGASPENNTLPKAGFNPFKISIGLNMNLPSFAINLPDRLKPSPLNLIFKNLSGNTMEVSSSNCYFELIDFDAY